jgi:hypothetical protein
MINDYFFSFCHSCVGRNLIQNATQGILACAGMTEYKENLSVFFIKSTTNNRISKSTITKKIVSLHLKVFHL